MMTALFCFVCSALSAAVGWQFGRMSIPAPLPAPPIIEPPADDIILRVSRDDLYQRACEVVATIDETETTAVWQNKWHQATGRLYTEFPDRSHRDITHAIEAALQTIS